MTNPATAQRPLTQSQILATIRNSAFDIEGALKNAKERIEANAKRIRSRYGDVHDTYIMTILRAEAEQDICLKCDGNCPKTFFKYKRPYVTVRSGAAYVINVPCKYGVDHAYRCRCVRAGVPDRYIGMELSDYRVTSDNERAVKIAKHLCTNKPDKGAFMYGGCGTGKTFLASLIAQSYLREGLSVAFYDMPGLLNSIKGTFDTRESTRDFLDEICTCRLLVIDDMGAEKVTDWSVEQLYFVVNARYNLGKPLVCTSNFDLDGLEKRLGSDITARRITSRIKEMCFQAFFGTKDWRS